MILILEVVPCGMVMRWYWLCTSAKFSTCYTASYAILRALFYNHSFHFVKNLLPFSAMPFFFPGYLWQRTQGLYHICSWLSIYWWILTIPGWNWLHGQSKSYWPQVRPRGISPEWRLIEPVLKWHAETAVVAGLGWLWSKCFRVRVKCCTWAAAQDNPSVCWFS